MATTDHVARLLARAREILADPQWAAVYEDPDDHHLDLNGFSLIPTRVRVPAIVPREVDGWQLLRWESTASRDWGEDVDDVPMGEYRTLGQAVAAALAWVLDDALAHLD